MPLPSFDPLDIQVSSPTMQSQTRKSMAHAQALTTGPAGVNNRRTPSGVVSDKRPFNNLGLGRKSDDERDNKNRRGKTCHRQRRKKKGDLSSVSHSLAGMTPRICSLLGRCLTDSLRAAIDYVYWAR